MSVYEEYVIVSLKMFLFTTVLICFTSALATNNGEIYQIPEPEIVAFYPNGLRVSIRDTPGIRLFAFHGNVNKAIRELEPGTLAKDNVHKLNNKWTFENQSVVIKPGDTIYYWLFVIKDDLGYRLTATQHTITKLLESPFNKQDKQEIAHSESNRQSLDLGNDIQPIPSLEKENAARLGICEQNVLNVTQNLINLQSQLSILAKRNRQLTHLIEKLPLAKTLTLSGVIPPDGSASSTVSFVIREKLELNPYVTFAVKNADNSITFEVSSLDEKLHILEVAKTKLLYSRIIIQ